jgi:hypothetical protein
MPMLQHLGSKGGNDGKGLDVEVPKHFIGPPAAQEPNFAHVHAGAKECHGTGGP